MADGKSDSDSEDVIVRDSIIKNKERTKSYWEQLMMAAASENQNMVKVRTWDINETSNSNPNSNRNSVSSTEYAEEPLNNHKEVIENGDAVAEMELELRNVKDEKRRIEREIRLRKERYGSDSVYGGLTMEDRIAMELQEMKAREEELKQLRSKLFLENGKDISPPKETTITNGVEELSSLHTTDDSNYSEYGSEEKEHSLDGNSRVNTPYSEDFMHRRTQSLDSVSSGHSSGSGSTLNDRERESSRRRILVRPYEDPEEEQTIIFKRNEKETPIEREIRLAKEREEELKREKGLIINNNNNNSEPEVFKIKNKLGNKKDAVQNDTRGVQHRLATNRIQQEIEEANERENELRTEGKILTTSEETVDAKVTRFTQLAETAILENRHTKEQKVMKRSSSMSQLLISMNNEEKPKETSTPAPIKTYVPQVTRRFAPNPAQKGIMQRFIATKGQLSLSTINTTPKFSTMSHISRPPPRRLTAAPTETIVPTRKGYTPVEEKIQEELKEMKKREEELRLQRAYSQSSKALARSQPNLLEITQDEEELNSWTSHTENTTKTAPRLSHSVSNPNLLDDSLDKVNRRTSRKRFSLLQEWENRIQSIQQEV